MADAFRGLTIRLGADARPLQQALSSVKASAGLAQRQLNLMNKALKFNGADVNALQARLGLVEDKALHAARSFSMLDTAVRETRNDSVSLSMAGEKVTMSIGEAANKMQRVYAEANKTRTAFNGVNAQIAHIDEAMAKIVQKEEKVKFTTAIQRVKKLREEMSAAGDETNEARQKIERLLRMVSQGGTGSKLFKDLETDALNLIRRYDKLRSESADLGKQLEALNKVQAFKEARVGLIAYEAELKQATAEAARFKSELYMTGSAEGLAGAIDKANRLESALKESTEEARRMREVYQAIPNSMDALKAKTMSAKNAQEALQQKAEALREVMRTIESSGKFDKLAAKTRNVYLDFERAEREAAEFGEAVAKAAAKVDKLEYELLDARTAVHGLSEGSKSVDALEHDLEKANAELAEMKGKAIAADEALERASQSKRWKQTHSELMTVIADMERLRAESSKLTKLGNFGTGLREFGYGMYSTVTPAILMAGRYAIDAANDIDSAYRDMRKTVNGTEEDFEHLRDAALTFSQTHVTSADQILEIESIGGQLGVHVQNLEKFSEVVSSLDIATNLDTETISQNLGQLSNIMKDMNQDLQEGPGSMQAFGDALVRLGNNSAAQEDKIMNVMMRIASMGTISGMSTPDLLALATATAATGQGAEAAGTALARTFSNFESAVGGASAAMASLGDVSDLSEEEVAELMDGIEQSSGKLEKFAEVAGMSAEEFATAWNERPMEAFQAFVEGLKRIDDAGGSVDNTLSELGINGVRQKQTLESLTMTTDVLSDALLMSNDAWNGISDKWGDAGDAAREAQRKSEGFSGELQMMKNNAQLLAAELADAATPMLKDLGNVFKDLTSFVKGLSPEFKRLLITVLGVTALAGPIGVWGGTTLRTISSIGNAVKAIPSLFNHLKHSLETTGMVLSGFGRAAMSTMPATAKVMQGAGAALQFLSTAGGMLAAAGIAASLIAIGATIKDFVEKSERMKHATTDLVEASKSLKGPSDALADSIANASGSLDKAASSASGYAMSAEEAAVKGGEFADKIREGYKEADADAAVVQYYSQKIQELAGNCGGSADKLAELQSAIDLYNEKTGDSIAVTDEFSGRINAQTEALQANTDAFVLNMYKKASEELAQEAIKYQLQVGQSLDETRAKFEEDWGWVTPDMDLGIQADAYGEARNEVLLLEKEYDSATRAAANLNAKTVEYASKAKEAEKAAKEVAAAVKGYAKALDEAGGNTSFEELAERCGSSTEDLAERLNKAGISAEDFARIGADSFAELYDEADENLTKVQKALNALDAFGLSTKEFEVTDDGTIQLADGRLIDLDKMTIDGKHFWVTDDGTIMTEDGKVNNLRWDIDKIPPNKSTSFTGDVSDLRSKVEEARDLLGSVGSRVISHFASKFGYASGSVFPSQAIRAIPRHASGALNGIVARPTLTNIGWTGEDGAEAILHMRNAGGAVIPLSNRRYVRPFAQAVASEMGGGPGNVDNSVTVVIDNATINSTPEIQAATRDYLVTLSRYAEMNND